MLLHLRPCEPLTFWPNIKWLARYRDGLSLYQVWDSPSRYLANQLILGQKVKVTGSQSVKALLAGLTMNIRSKVKVQGDQEAGR